MGGEFDGLDDARVGAATAEVAFEGGADGGVGGLGLGVEEGDGAEDHGRGAEAALEGGGIEEGLLDGMEGLGSGGEAFDGGDGIVGGRGRWRDAGACGLAVDEDGAGAALAFAAAGLGAGEVEALTERVEEGFALVHVYSDAFAVDRQFAESHADDVILAVVHGGGGEGAVELRH